MASTAIPSTLIATSQPLDLNASGAIGYFPDFDLHLAASSQGSIFSVNPTILLWNFNASAGWTVFIGVTGPAIALNLTLDGSHDGQGFQATVSKDEIQGGLLFGLTVGFNIGFTVNQASLHWVKDGWHSHFEKTWNTKFNANASVNFDLIAIILGIVVKIFEEDGKTDTLLQKVNNINNNLLGSYGLFDDVTNGFASTGNFSVNPGFSLPINIVPFIPGLAQINEGLEALLGGLFIGPTIGMAIPATVHFNGISIANQAYQVTGRNGNQISGTIQPGGPTAQAGQLQVNMDRSPGLDLTLGLGANVTLLKLFSIGGSISFDVLGALGIRPDLGTFPFTLANTLGSTTVADLGELHDIVAEVVFETPVS